MQLLEWMLDAAQILLQSVTLENVAVISPAMSYRTAVLMCLPLEPIRVVSLCAE